MSPNLMGNKKNPPPKTINLQQEANTKSIYHILITHFLSTIASHYFLQTLHETSINDNIGVDIWML